MWVIFCQSVTKRSGIAVKVSKSSVSTWLDKSEFIAVLPPVSDQQYKSALLK